MVRTSVTHPAIASCANVFFLPHFDVIFDPLLNRRKVSCKYELKDTSSVLYVLSTHCKQLLKLAKFF